ncbi:hypothetical protein [Methylocystis bryophila]|uniref:PEP-CTERM sorting domain-containing protein n=1 Tax=Methylocystis bryophila TaxID=655015 RepID=A0A1W6MRI3_9HYPH|nr:hypothetical protein [Methylocystis bryophila]ARN80203.1 hypothetical protein B1812_02880 [Methylocystis bryophila]BDV40153.1 hypothetical protein DSM21852_34060 [Methylocystis bryophila]
MRLSRFAVAAAATFAFATPAFAGLTLVPGTAFSSSAGGGNSGSDNQGNSWVWSTTNGVSNPVTVPAGSPAWGVPGLGTGDATYTAATSANAFAVTFLNVPAPVIDQTASPSTGGYNEYTRFESYDSHGNSVAWSEVFVGPNTVEFFAPTGVSLSSGQNFFVNAVFDSQNLDGSNTGFTAAFYDFSAPAPVPGVGLAGLAALALAGFYARARRA